MDLTLTHLITQVSLCAAGKCVRSFAVFAAQDDKERTLVTFVAVGCAVLSALRRREATRQA
jgi:hypothetical protein